MDEVLDRRRITGPISYNMPSCVLAEIAKSRGLKVDVNQLSSLEYRSRIIITMDTKEAPVVSFPCKSKDYSALARYVNSDTSLIWDKSTLLDAYSMLNNSKVPYTSDIDKLVLGDPIPSNIHRICACTLYAWCLGLGGAPGGTMTIEELRRY